ncbi:molybdenum cofactor guanylyltransferase [Halocalculus aciditolerans]|uniref:Probable molybdenum cofactor guanylyltransferase n=1 Tax=Halocalculus aciditolerans TaxID=1383812 RepID=A0A830FDQ2_9EURY|nr:molybdenum cofactor guanylyltransferase [Halocalculus aciditolerans]GGL64877.1 hypothetical protein GCM10009039_23510 [Halocalculus aciditolerans]
MTDSTTRGVLLAGGNSTRFADGDKALARLDGTPLIRRAADALADATGRPPVVAAGDHPPDAYRDALDDPDFLPDAPDFRGPLAGLASAARALDGGWLLVVACDMPRLDAAALRWLDTERRRAPTGTDAVVPIADGVPQPLCAAYRRTALRDALDDLSETAGPRALLDHLRTHTLGPDDTPPTVDLHAALTNVNTTDALEDILREEGRR